MEERAIESCDLREVLAAGRGAITDLSLSCRARVRPPDLMIGEVTPALLRAYFDQSVVLGASLFRVRDAEVTAEGVILIDGRFALCNQLNVDPTYIDRYHADLARRLPGLHRETIEGEVVLLAGMGHLVYGHWIADFLPKLYLLHRAGYRIERLRYLLPADTPDFARAWLRLLGIGDGQLRFYRRQDDLLTCRSLLVPSALRFVGRVSPLLREARDFLLRRLDGPRRIWRRAAKPAAGKRILVSRSENGATLNPRRFRDRELFETAASARGFAVVRPEELDIPGQIALFRSAAILVGEYGSGLHASLFCEPGATVLSARHNGLALGFLQSAIDHAVGHASGYLIGGAPAADGSFGIGREEIDMAFDWLDWTTGG